MKIVSVIVLIIIGSLPLSAQTRVPKTKPNERLTITPTEISAKAVTSQARKRRSSDTNNPGYYFRSRRVIQTLGAVYLTGSQSFTFIAGDSIVLNPGFEVDSTAEFTAEINSVLAETPVVRAPESALAISTNPDAAPATAGTLKAFTLFPNPANEQFNIWYEVTKTAQVSLALYTLEGTPVQSFIASKQQEPGSYKLALPVYKIPSGVYVVSLKINNQTISQRVVLR